MLRPCLAPNFKVIHGPVSSAGLFSLCASAVSAACDIFILPCIAVSFFNLLNASGQG